MAELADPDDASDTDAVAAHLGHHICSLQLASVDPVGEPAAAHTRDVELCTPQHAVVAVAE